MPSLRAAVPGLNANELKCHLHHPVGVQVNASSAAPSVDFSVENPLFSKRFQSTFRHASRFATASGQSEKSCVPSCHAARTLTLYTGTSPTILVSS